MQTLKFGSYFSIEVPDDFVVIENFGQSNSHPDKKRSLICEPGNGNGVFSVEWFTTLDGDCFSDSVYDADHILEYLGRIETLTRLLKQRECELSSSGPWHWVREKAVVDGKEYYQHELAHDDVPEMIAVIQNGEDLFDHLLPYIKVQCLH